MRHPGKAGGRIQDLTSILESQTPQNDGMMLARLPAGRQWSAATRQSQIDPSTTFGMTAAVRLLLRRLADRNDAKEPDTLRNS